jgi:hypothetical protein
MNLQVNSIRYFKTNRGLGYQAKTNIKGIEILNDGQGGGTYLEGKYSKLLALNLEEKTERELERMLDVYERSQGVIC